MKSLRADVRNMKKAVNRMSSQAWFSPRDAKLALEWSADQQREWTAAYDGLERERLRAAARCCEKEEHEEGAG